MENPGNSSNGSHGGDSSGAMPIDASPLIHSQELCSLCPACNLRLEEVHAFAMEMKALLIMLQDNPMAKVLLNG